MTTYDTQTGYYVLRDADGRIGAKAAVSTGEHTVPDWVDESESFDVDSAEELADYVIHVDYLVQR